MANGLELPFGIKPVNPTPVDAFKYNNSDLPFTNVAEVNTQIVSALRYQGLTVYVYNGATIDEYWFKSGIDDDDLILKESGIPGTVGTTGNLVKWDSGELSDSVLKEQSLVNTLSSGLRVGGSISINADTSKFDIGAGSGVIVDNVTDVDNPVIYNVSWSAFTAISPTNLATQQVTYLFIDNTGAIFQSNTSTTGTTRRLYISLGSVAHTNNTTIGAAINNPDIFVSPISQIRDVENAIGIINLGNFVTPNGTNLNINKSVGALVFNGINFNIDTSEPSKKTYAAVEAPSLRLRTQTGNGSTSTTIDPNYYDLDGTVTLLDNNKAQNMRVFLTLAGNIVVQYGQTIYNGIATATTGLQTETFIVYPNLLENSVLIGIITIKQGATDLSDPDEALFYNVSKFGELGGAGAGVSTSTLQSAYNNSLTPEILTNATLGAFSLKRGSALDSDDIIEGLNAAGTKTFNVTGDGDIYGNYTKTNQEFISSTYSVNVTIDYQNTNYTYNHYMNVDATRTFSITQSVSGSQFFIDATVDSGTTNTDILFTGVGTPRYDQTYVNATNTGVTLDGNASTETYYTVIGWFNGSEWRINVNDTFN